MLCVFCGLKIDSQVPVLVNSIDLSPPWNESGTVGKDVLSNKYCCQNCYKDILSNAAKASQYASDQMIKSGAGSNAA